MTASSRDTPGAGVLFRVLSPPDVPTGTRRHLGAGIAAGGILGLLLGAVTVAMTSRRARAA